MRSFFLVAALGFSAFACGSKPAPVANAAPATADAGTATPNLASSGASAMTTDAGAASGSASTGTADAADAGGAAIVDGHPFAKDSAAAESMIDDAIDSRHSAMDKCANEARKRSKDPHRKIALLIGIDQEGNLLGVKRPSKKDNEDEALLVCVRAALKGAPFPKSHAGVITIKKTYEETLSTTSTNPNITPN